MDARKFRFAPNTPDPLCANYTRQLMCFFLTEIMGGGTFFKVGGHMYTSKNYRKFL